MNSSRVLNSGYSIPFIGLGTYLADSNVEEGAVTAAIKCGYRMFDCASFYNHKPVGIAIKKAINEGIVKREELFITTKLWITDWKPENMEKALHQSLLDLQLDYVDLYLVHYPLFFNLPKDEEERRNPDYYFSVDKLVPDSPEYRIGYDIDNMKITWKKMEEFVSRGLVKSIGVSNFSTKKLTDLLSFCSIKPAMNQIELHPFLQQWEMKEFCDTYNICLTAYFPLGGARPDNCPNWKSLMDDPIIVNIGKSHKKTGAQVLIRWAVQRGTICIPKSISPSRIKSNANIFDFELSAYEMAKIKSMDLGQRSSKGFVFITSDKSWKDIWDGEYVN